MEKGNFTNDLSDENRKAIWIKLLDEIGHKSLFDYTDEEWAPIELRLMRGAGRRYKDVVEALAVVFSLKEARKVVRKWFIEKETLLNSHREELFKEMLRKNKQERLTSWQEKEIKKEMSRIEHTLHSIENYPLKFLEREKEFNILYYLGYNRSDFILDELEEAEKTDGEEREHHLKSAQEMYDYCKRNKEIIPNPIENYFFKKRNKPSAEEIRDWYLENKPDIKIDSSISNN